MSKWIVLIILPLLLLAGQPTSLYADDSCWTETRLTTTPNDDLDPHWSPDGKQIAFVGHHEGNPEVYIMDVATHDLGNISNDPNDDYNPVWSPDGQYVAFMHRIIKYAVQPVQIRLYNLETGALTPVTPDYRGIYPFQVKWSSDSDHLLFQDYPAYHVYDVQTRRLRELASTGENISDSIQVWPAPDGQTLAVYSYPQRRFTFIDVTSGAEQLIFTGGSVRWEPRWSPDSSRLAFISGEYPAPWTLYVYDRTNKSLTLVDEAEGGAIGALVWSHDNRLAWGKRSPTQDYLPNLMLEADPPYNAARQLAELNIYFSPSAWSPARDQLAFNSYAGMYVLDLPTGNYRDFIQGLGMVSSVAWSPDGNKVIAGISQAWRSITQIAMVDINTGELCVYSSSDPTQYMYIHGALELLPDGKHILFSEHTFASSDLVMLTLPE